MTTTVTGDRSSRDKVTRLSRKRRRVSSSGVRVNSSSNWSITSSNRDPEGRISLTERSSPRSSATRSSSRLGGRRTATRNRAAASSSKGKLPG